MPRLPEAGPAGPGAPGPLASAVLVHGAGAGGGDWIGWQRVLSAAGLRVHAPDQPCLWKNVEQGRCVTPGFSLFDLDIAYAASAQWRYSFHLRNVFGHDPVSYDVEQAGYDFATDDPRGRYYLLSALYRF